LTTILSPGSRTLFLVDQMTVSSQFPGARMTPSERIIVSKPNPYLSPKGLQPMMLLERAPSCTRQRQQKVVSLLEMISLQMSVVCTRSESVALCPCPTWLNMFCLKDKRAKDREWFFAVLRSSFRQPPDGYDFLPLSL
jgi:hypothetical protein